MIDKKLNLGYNSNYEGGCRVNTSQVVCRGGTEKSEQTCARPPHFFTALEIRAN